MRLRENAESVALYGGEEPELIRKNMEDRRKNYAYEIKRHTLRLASLAAETQHHTEALAAVQEKDVVLEMELLKL